MPRELDLRDEGAYLAFTLNADELPLGAQQKSPTATLVERSLMIAKATSEVLGAQAGQPLEFSPLPGSPSTRTGATTIHLEQQVQGLPVFLAGQSVRFSGTRDVQRTQARLVSPSNSLDVVPDVPVESAVQAAAMQVTRPSDDEQSHRNAFRETSPAAGSGVMDFEPKVLAEFSNIASQPTVLEQGPFSETITAYLTWVPAAQDLRLAWDIILGVSEQEGAFRVLVDARNRSILYCTQLVPSATCRGNVFQINPDTPRKVVSFPLEWASYGLDVSPDLPPTPDAWVSGSSTDGYTTMAGLSPSVSPFTGESADGVIFDPADPKGADQKILNAFYGACFMHDLTYLLGFRESDGSYQEGAVSAAGRPSRSVQVEIHSEPVLGTAHWWPLGTVPTMRLGPKQETGRHSSLDMTIVFHEYMHGVSTRLVGGGAVSHPLAETQSRGMGEGWGDYFACTLIGTSLIGQWLTDDDVGLRRFPYDQNFQRNQINFANLSTLKLYEIGSLWCAALLDMNRRIGARLSLQLVLEGMKTLPVNPSLLDGRDEILLTLDDLRDSGAVSVSEHSRAKAGIWAAFAALGMGVGAISQGPSIVGAVADNSVP
ncbi:M36 family metallopeptidase [Streptomyces aureus]|uniref:M36 family metallopeptidase n=1 Tax=Streptomyces aureus TaxID=193461 RepID=UPI0033C64726